MPSSSNSWHVSGHSRKRLPRAVVAFVYACLTSALVSRRLRFAESEMSILNAISSRVVDEVGTPYAMPRLARTRLPRLPSTLCRTVSLLSLLVAGSIFARYTETTWKTGPSASASSERRIRLPRTALSASHDLRLSSTHASRFGDALT